MKYNIREFQINGDSVYLKKSKIFGWNVVHPIKIKNKINWKNLLVGGSWIKFLIYLFGILFLLGAVKEYSQAVKIANACINNPNLFPIGYG